MSIQTSFPESENSVTLRVQVLTRSEFIDRHVAAIETTARGGPAFKFAVLPHTKGTDLALEDGFGALFLCHTDLQLDFGNEPRAWLCDTDFAMAAIGAWVDSWPTIRTCGGELNLGLGQMRLMPSRSCLLANGKG